VNYTHVTWPLNGFHETRGLVHRTPRRFPLRYLRYWLPRMILEKAHARLRRPLSVLEVGIGDGKMVEFLAIDANHRFKLPSWVERWDGVDVQADQSVLGRYPYSDFIEVDIDRPFSMWRRYDAIIAVHVLEHLLKPEASLVRLTRGLNSGGILVGNSPTMPAMLAVLHEPWLRWKHRRVLNDVAVHRHVSVISPRRIRQFAKLSGLQIELLTGTFFLRCGGLVLEDFEIWVRANLLWGATFPCLGGELCFSLREPS